MTRAEFFVLFADNLGTYIIALVISTLLMLPIIKSTCKSIIDPIFYAVIGAIFANAIPFFLLLENQINTSYFIYFIISEALLWFGFWIAFKLPIHIKKYRINHDFQKSSSIFYIFFLLFVSLFFIQLVFFGFGAFSSERLSVFKDSGGWGIILKICTFICTFNLFYSFSVLDNLNGRSLKLKLTAGLAILLSIIYIFLQGAKSGLLQVLFIFFYYYVLRSKRVLPKKVKNLLFCTVIGGMLLTSTITASSDNLSTTLTAVGERTVVNGDIYWYALPDGQIEHLKPAPWLEDLLRPFIYSLRLKDRSEAIPGVGTQIVYQINPRTIGNAVGANSRPPIWSYAMFGKMGIVFTLFWGLFIGRLCHISIYNIPAGTIGNTVGYTLLSAALMGLTDPQLTFMAFFDGLIGIALMLPIIGLFDLRKSLPALHNEKSFG